MKKQLFTLLVTASFLSAIKPALADTQSVSSDQELQKVAAQTTALESEIKSLRAEVRQLKANQRYLKTTTQKVQANSLRNSEAIRVSNTQLEEPGLTTKTPVTPFRHSPVTYLSGTPVVIAPYIGEHTAFDSFDLVTNYSSYNLDLHLLQLRQQMDKQYTDACLPVPNDPMLMLSGKIEGQAMYQTLYNGGWPNGSHTSKIDLASAELDIIPTVGPWASGYVSLAYDNAPTANRALVNNSRVRAKRAFLTFGNLNRFPLYLTVGQLDVPFGDYGTYMLSDVLPQDIFDTRARTILLGYQGASGQGPYAEVFAFNGDTNTSKNNNINNVGANAGYSFKHGIYSVDLGLSGIANVADSLPMQEAGAPGFQGFSVAPSVTALLMGANPNPEVLQRQVPGLAFHGNIGVGPFGVIGRYMEATSAFNPQDLMFDNHGARPHAMDTEAYYNFHVFNRPTVATIAYDKTWEALALGVPQTRYMAAVLTSIWKSTIEEIEYRHDINYGTHDSAAGAGNMPVYSTGGSSNTVTLQVGIYF